MYWDSHYQGEKTAPVDKWLHRGNEGIVSFLNSVFCPTNVNIMEDRAELSDKIVSSLCKVIII